MDWHKKYVPANGYTAIIAPSPEGLEYITFGILHLQAGESYEKYSAQDELGLILVTGKCKLTAGNQRFGEIGRRSSFFSGKATSAYIPPHTECVIKAVSDLEMVIGSVPAEAAGKPTIVRPGSVVSKYLGHGPMRRRVDFLIYNQVPASHIIVGETVHTSGGWSGYPPHKHDQDNEPVESANEEVYLVKIEPPQGFGFLAIYDNESLDEAYRVKNNDIIAIPRGYHPMVAAPGYKVGFIWFMAGKKRQWKPATDPDHAWVAD